jgi:ribosomal-protein-serine acetyltransferase
VTEPSQSQTGAHNKPVESMIVDTDLCLDILKISDAEELFALVEKNREYLRKTLPWLDEVRSLDEQISYIVHCDSDYELGKGVMYAIRNGGRIVGTIGLNWLDFENRSCGVGYWISEHQTGLGLATRTCSRLIDHCFMDLNLHRFVLEASVENTASCRVAVRLGMRMEGVNKDREWLYNRYVDGKMYAITKPEWLSSSD